MGTKCVPLLVGLFLCSYEANFIQQLLRKYEKLILSFNCTSRYIDGVLSLNNSKFGYNTERIYPIFLEIEDTTNSVKFAQNLDVSRNSKLGSFENKTL